MATGQAVRPSGSEASGAGACAEPRTSIPLLAGEVHRALVFSGGPGEVSSPLRIFVPWYPAVQGSGLKNVSATPNRAPLLVITVDPAAIAAGRAENVSCSAAPRVRVICEVVSRFAISAPSVGVLSVIRPGHLGRGRGAVREQPAQVGVGGDELPGEQP